MVIFIIFVVCMILWLLSLVAPAPPPPYGRYTGLLPWIAVLCLYLLGGHALR